MLNKKIKVAFVLPGISNIPNGGYKIVYEYANRLSQASKNYDISIIHVENFNEYIIRHNSSKIKKKLRKVRAFLRLFQKKISFRKNKINWMNIGSEVKFKSILSYKKIEDFEFDAIFATSILTAKPIFNLPEKCGKKFYLIQGWENWHGFSDYDVIDTWKLGMTNIVVSKWLKLIAEKERVKVDYISNGLSFSDFKIIKPVFSRDKFNISTLGHVLESKGLKDVVDAVNICRVKFPDITLNIYSAYSLKSISYLKEDWIRVIVRPNKNELLDLYNYSSIFVAASWSEGWGLPAAESLQCGCALVATQNGGYQEFAIHGTTALVCPIKRPDLLAKNIIKLIENNTLRYRIALDGNKYIKKYEWSNSVEKMSRIIDDNIRL